MMSARLLHAADASEQGARSRRGFYARLDRTYAFLLALAMRHRLWIAGLAGVAILSAVPLYQMVKQEHIRQRG